MEARERLRQHVIVGCGVPGSAACFLILEDEEA